MPAPPNTTAATATAITALPYNTTQNVHDAGTTYTVWYKYTATSAEDVVGAFGFGDLTTYRPTISVQSGTPSSLQPVLGIGAQNRPVQFPVTAGTTYYLQFSVTGNPTPAVLTLNVQTAPCLSAPIGSIVVPDDAGGFPAAIVDATAGNVLRFKPFAAGEWGDVLENGTMFMDNAFSTPHNTVQVYSSLFAPLATIDPFAVVVTALIIRVSRGLQIFYVGALRTGGDKLTTISGTGVQGPIWTLPAPSIGLGSIAPNNDGSIVYVSSGTQSNQPVKRFLPASSTFGSDLLAGRGATVATFDMLVLADGTLILGDKDTATSIISVRRVATDGTILGTYTGVTSDGPAPKLAFDPADTHFWLWTHANNVSTFRRIIAATMTQVSASTTREYEDGAYQGAETATPDKRFGNSFSCPFFLLRVAVTGSCGGGGGGGGGGTPGPTTAIRRVRRAPHLSAEQKWQFFSRFQLDFEPGVGAASGSGTDPQITLRWSDDGGHTWHAPQTVSAGLQAQYQRRAIWRRLGRGRDRVFEIVVNDPVRWALVAAFLDATPGVH